MFSLRNLDILASREKVEWVDNLSLMQQDSEDNRVPVALKNRLRGVQRNRHDPSRFNHLD